VLHDNVGTKLANGTHAHPSNSGVRHVAAGNQICRHAACLGHLILVQMFAVNVDPTKKPRELKTLWGFRAQFHKLNAGL